MPKHRPPNTATTVWEIAHPGHHNEFHPTQKPIEIFAWPIRWHTEPGDVVLEPFSGSGTQLVAAEQEGRICFAMEMSPPFVASALERMSIAGCKPDLLEPGDGRVIDVPQVDAQEPAEVE
ncbi:MAG: DNA methyltransferase [Chloroflexota bacterium]